ncbi:MAG: ParB/RepB/Spo0J family partition protein [Syntrophomonadaceae bacterium]
MTRRIRGLGRGLDALFSGGGEDLGDTDLVFMDISQIFPRKGQPRKNFDQQSLQELAESIKEHGLLQPLLVRRLGKGYEIIAGERRWRAAAMAGIDSVPVIIKESDDNTASEIALIENLQREDLNVIEEAAAYKTMLEEYGYTQEKLAERIGKSRSHIANSLRILGLPDEVLELIEQQRISAGHARALLALSGREEQIAAANEIIKGSWSVRTTEEQVSRRKNKKAVENKPVEIEALEDKLQKHLGTKTRIVRHKKGGRIEITFFDDEDLERIAEMLGIDL